jgi:hypothetical protein
MERLLLVGGILLAVGLAMAGVFVILTSYGSSFEAIEDTIVGWLSKA